MHRKRECSKAWGRIVSGGVAAFALTAAASACGSSSSGTASSGGDHSITWGLIAPFSGTAADYGPPEKAADVAAINWVNSHGGIKIGSTKYTMKLKTYDSAYDPTQAVTVTRQAVTQDGLKFLEVDGGGIVPAVQPITEPANAMIFAIAGGDSYLGKSHALTFRPYYDIPASTNAILTEFMKDSGVSAPKVDFVEPDDDLGHSLSGKAAEYASKLGFSTKIIYLSRTSTDYTPTATKVAADHPDVIDFGPTPGDQYGPFIKSVLQQGYKGVFSFPDTLDTATVAKSVPLSKIAGSLTAPAWTSFPSPAGRYFSAEAKKLTGSVQGWTA